ncbi:class I SAM-dependent methyltransferase [Dyella sp. ASV21]|uniref:class I SAM-dependent methyltransferase n=1 Tax=Dyella sp. ASV21 TaxID=2795114 RepID=UPI0018EB2635|nr:class I SAM-dependent methyltransferase [Dyella sp. ASV21]
MFRRIGFTLCLLPSLWLFATLAQAATPPAPELTLQQAVAGSWRSDANKARDTYRHPIETLQFFGIQPGMTVIELSPGGGWYTEILAPYLAAHGQLIEAAPPKAEKFNAKLKANPDVFGHIAKIIPFAPPDAVQLGPAHSADMVLTFRNTHDWLIHSPDTLDAVFKAAFDVLKPGGILGIEEHRAKPFGDPRVTAGALHRISEDYMIATAMKAGFQLAGVSQINANPNDPEDINVHRLPPDLAGPDDEHAKMKAIGESDRMTLKFVKP